VVGINCIIPIPGVQETSRFSGIISFALYEQNYRIGIMFCTINLALGFFLIELFGELSIKFGG